MGTLVWSCVWLLYVTVARLLMLALVFTVCADWWWCVLPVRTPRRDWG